MDVVLLPALASLAFHHLNHRAGMLWSMSVESLCRCLLAFRIKALHSYGEPSLYILSRTDVTQQYRTNICPYASGLVCLSANSVINFDNRDSLEVQDRLLKVEAVDVLGEMARQTNHQTLTRVLEAFIELDSQYRFMTATKD